MDANDYLEELEQVRQLVRVSAGQATQDQTRGASVPSTEASSHAQGQTQTRLVLPHKKRHSWFLDDGRRGAKRIALEAGTATGTSPARESKVVAKQRSIRDYFSQNANAAAGLSFNKTLQRLVVQYLAYADTLRFAAVCHSFSQRLRALNRLRLVSR